MIISPKVAKWQRRKGSKRGKNKTNIKYSKWSNERLSYMMQESYMESFHIEWSNEIHSSTQRGLILVCTPPRASKQTVAQYLCCSNSKITTINMSHVYIFNREQLESASNFTQPCNWCPSGLADDRHLRSVGNGDFFS